MYTASLCVSLLVLVASLPTPKSSEISILLLLSRLLPNKIKTHEIIGNRPCVDIDWREAALTNNMAPRRRSEFLIGRYVAKQALIKLGRDTGPVLRGEAGEPLWPNGVVGSITHCRGYVASATGLSRDYTSLGIDAELSRPLPLDVVPYVLVEKEMRIIEKCKSRNLLGMVMFSAKESVFKAWYCITKRLVDFTDILITLDVRSNIFSATVNGETFSRSNNQMMGRYLISDELIITAFVVECY